MRSRGPVLLGETPVFPPVSWADENGLLAVGGDVTPEWLLAAYPRGIFPWPWYEETPMLWWAPDPRFVLLPDELHVPRSLRPRLRDPDFAVRFDTCFEAVMRGCAEAPRPGDEGTWITEAMIAGYTSLHERGCAVSAECFVDGELAGGVYGVRLGGAFFGESMFHRVPDASKVAFVALVRRLAAEGGTLLDCQQETPHLARFGARNIPRPEFQRRLAAAL